MDPPGRPSGLQRGLRPADALRMREAELRRRIQRIEDIPSPSASLDRILELAADCESEIGSLTAAIESDPAVTSRVLRLSNSAYFGLPGRIETVERALVVIGYKNVLALATCAALAPLFEGDDESLDRSELWLHCCATAEAARILGARSSEEPSAAYTAGLLHDLGVVILSQALGSAYADVIDESRRRGVALAEAEREALGVDHGWAAAVLFERWTLPQRLRQAVEHHAAPEKDASGFAALVATADHLAASAGFVGPTGRVPLDAPPLAWLEAFGLKAEELESVAEELEERRGAIELGAGAKG